MKKNHEFRRVYARGKNTATATLAIYCSRINRDYNLLGFTVSTKVGKAVIRNAVRRKLREIYRLNEHKLVKGLDIVIVARVKSRYVDYWQLEKDFLLACEKLGILAEGSDNQ